MATNLNKLLQQGQTLEKEYYPIIFNLQIARDAESLSALLHAHPEIEILDELHLQLRDLVKLENPSLVLSEQELDFLSEAKVPKEQRSEFGVWVYYPWLRRLVHLLNEEEFIKVRTVRNLYKITPEEQSKLRSKKIGVIGLSVGQSAAITIAMERLAGEIRIADYDHLELSNMNRLRTSVANIGLPKTVIVAREISEIDPFIKVICFHEGINEQNISRFLESPSKIDLLVEECDSIDIKILCREHTSKLGIPVVMDTSDKGLLDIERFDLDKNYPILHGLIDKKVTAQFLSTLKTSEEKFPYILPIIGFENISYQLKASGMQVGKTVTTWPQIAGDVTLGGALVAFSARKILLNHKINSGRYYFDFEEKLMATTEEHTSTIRFEKPLTRESIDMMSSKLDLPTSDHLDDELIRRICIATTAAPSAGNNQKWKLHYTKNNLIFYADKLENYAYSDNCNIASLIGVGCAIENTIVFCESIGIQAETIIYDKMKFPLVASISFHKNNPIPKHSLAQFIFERRTTRSNQVQFLGEKSIYDELIELNNSDAVSLRFLHDKAKIMKIRDLVCKADRIRFMNLQGHQEFYQHELRWNQADAETHKDGLDITYFDLSPSDHAGLRLAKDIKVIEYLNSFGGGHGFERISAKNFNNADSLGFVFCSNFDQENLVEAGKMIERTWLAATKFELGVFPITVLPMLTSFVFEDIHGFNSDKTILELKEILHSLLEVLEYDGSKKMVYMFKTTGVEKEYRPSQRHPIQNKLIIS